MRQRGRRAAGGGLFFLGRHWHVALANPAFDAQLAIQGVGLGKSVINVGPQGVQRHPALMIFLDPGDFRPAQAARPRAL